MTVSKKLVKEVMVNSCSHPRAVIGVCTGMVTGVLAELLLVTMLCLTLGVGVDMLGIMKVAAVKVAAVVIVLDFIVKVAYAVGVFTREWDGTMISGVPGIGGVVDVNASDLTAKIAALGFAWLP